MPAAREPRWFVTLLKERAPDGSFLYGMDAVRDAVAALAFAVVQAAPGTELADSIRAEMHRVMRVGGVDASDDAAGAKRKIDAYYASHPLPAALITAIHRLLTSDVVTNAAAKRSAKNADWIVGNDVSSDVMGGQCNRVHLITAAGVEDWPEADKAEVARHLVKRIAEELT